MEYNGYVGRIEYDDEAELFHGEIVNLKDVITFQGRSVEELRSALEDSVRVYINFCRERGEEPEKPFSGRFLVRVSPDVHRAIAVAAAREEKSVNAWVRETLVQAAEELV